MTDKIRILGFAGSLRKASLNRALLKTATELLPSNAEMEIFDLDGIPPFNEDIEVNLPARVVEFKKKIKEADAILIACPEYNHSMTGVLKNALDWGTRPSGDNSFDGKTAAIIGASSGAIGTARAQEHLRNTFVNLNVYAVPKPEVLVTFGEDKIKNGILVDEPTKAQMKKLIDVLVAFTMKMKK